MTITREELAALVAKATPGPLRTTKSKSNGDVAILDSDGGIVGECYEAIRHADEQCADEALANAELFCLAPALAAMLLAGPRVKPLRWVKNPSDRDWGRGDWTAVAGGAYFDIAKDLNEWVYRGKFYRILAIAKAAAQADHTARVLAELEGW